MNDEDSRSEARRKAVQRGEEMPSFGEDFETAFNRIRKDPQFRITLRTLELYDTGLDRVEAIKQARRDWWINHKAKPNGIGPVCIVCDNLIDWAAADHEPDCTVPEFYGIKREPRKTLAELLQDASTDDHGNPNPNVMRKIIDKFVPEEE